MEGAEAMDSPRPRDLAGAGITDERISAAMQYFHRVDAADPSLLDLMTDDVQIYFPKFGVGYGKDAVRESARGFHAALRRIEHDFDRMNIMVSGDHVIVEGFEKGVMRDGTRWPVDGLSEGRYCNVFEFDGTLIKRVHIYVDPDFASTDRERLLWGESVRMTRP